MKNIFRWYTLLLLIVFLATNVSSAKQKNKNYMLFVGTYTKTTSKGIYAYHYDAVSGQLKPLGLAAESVNPSFLAVDHSGKFLYAVNEVSDYQGAASGAVTAFAINRRSGQLSRLNQVSSRGADPCYLALDATGKYLLVANYTGGNVAVFPVLKEGRLGESSAMVQHTGRGPNPQRQEAPHAHWIETTADNRFAIAADLGLDKLLVYRFDAANGSLLLNDPASAKVEPGAGPRHVAFSSDQKFAYSVNELQSTVTAFSYDEANGVLKPVQTISTLPKDFAGTNDTAEIQLHPNGKFLYASNRGHDSIAVFSVAPGTGGLALIGSFPTGGKTPRHFAIDPSGSHLLVANQESNNIVVFRIDAGTGRLTPTGEIESVASPVCLVFLAVD
jgi:6-phosphogluconolactonase